MQPKGRGRWLGSALIALLLILGLNATTFADLRIVHQTEDEQTEVLVKNHRIRWHLSLEDWVMIDCTQDQVTLVAPPRYWTGPTSELKEMLAEMQAIIAKDIASALEAGMIPGLPPAPARSEPPPVRVTRVGDDHVAGYRATEYRVETGGGSQWTTFERIWVSRDLLREVEDEVGRCIRVMIELSQQLAVLVPLGDASAVYSDSSYQALFDQGFPVRSITTLSLFGTEWEIQSELVEVSRTGLDEALFTVPATYERSDSLADFLAQ